ncbi:hypothetical protein D3C73_1117810 [compost metagenome]
MGGRTGGLRLAGIVPSALPRHGRRQPHRIPQPASQWHQRRPAGGLLTAARSFHAAIHPARCRHEPACRWNGDDCYPVQKLPLRYRRFAGTGQFPRSARPDRSLHPESRLGRSGVGHPRAVGWRAAAAGAPAGLDPLHGARARACAGRRACPDVPAHCPRPAHRSAGARAAQYRGHHHRRLTRSHRRNAHQPQWQCTVAGHLTLCLHLFRCRARPADARR